MADILAQTYTDPQTGELHYVYYNPDTGQYHDESINNMSEGGMAPPAEPAASPAPPLPDTPPTSDVDRGGMPAQGTVLDDAGQPTYLAQQMLDPVTGKMTTQMVPIADPGATNPLPADDSGAPVTDASGATDGSGGSYDSNGYYHSGSGYSRGSSGGGYSSGGYSSHGSSGGGYSSGSSGMDNLHNAQAGQQAWIAQHTQPSGGGSTQKDATVPGGAAAGAWGARSAPPVHGPSSGGGSSGGSSGGGGGQIGSTIRSIRSNILSNLGGMFGGGSSSSYTPYHAAKPAPPPKPFQQPDPKMHGFARPYDTLNAQNTVFAHPEYLIPRAVGVPTTSGAFDQLAALPMGPLASILADSHSRAPTDTNRYINTAARLYDQIANGPDWFDGQQLMNRLLHPKPGTALGIQYGRGTPPLTAQDKYNEKLYGASWVDPRTVYRPPSAGTQADQMSSQLAAINRVQYGSKTAAAFNHWDQAQIANWGSRNIKRKTGGGQTLPQFLRGRV